MKRSDRENWGRGGETGREREIENGERGEREKERERDRQTYTDRDRERQGQRLAASLQKW